MWHTALWQDGILPLQWGVAIGASLVAAVCDVRTGRIPNRLTFTLLLAGLVWATLRCGSSGLADAGAATVVTALPFVLLFVYGGGGAGDAKLMGALGAWLGLVGGTVALLCVAMAGIVLAITWAWHRKRLKSVGGNLMSIGWQGMYFVATGGRRFKARPLDERDQMLPMPYGLAIFAGTALAGIGVFIWHVRGN